MIETVLGFFFSECVDGLWGREAENTILYQYRKALILASELIRPAVQKKKLPDHPHTRHLQVGSVGLDASSNAFRGTDAFLVDPARGFAGDPRGGAGLGQVGVVSGVDAFSMDGSTSWGIRREPNGQAIPSANEVHFTLSNGVAVS